MSQNLAWNLIKGIGRQREKPSGRSGHTLTTLGPNVYMFGGLKEGASPAGPTDEMWLLAMSSTEASWHLCSKKVGHEAEIFRRNLIFGLGIDGAVESGRWGRIFLCHVRTYSRWHQYIGRIGN